jgi:hypothetical protein
MRGLPYRTTVPSDRAAAMSASSGAGAAGFVAATGLAAPTGFAAGTELAAALGLAAAATGLTDAAGLGEAGDVVSAVAWALVGGAAGEVAGAAEHAPAVATRTALSSRPNDLRKHMAPSVARLGNDSGCLQALSLGARQTEQCFVHVRVVFTEQGCGQCPRAGHPIRGAHDRCI